MGGYNSKDEKAQSPKKEPKVEAAPVKDILIRSPIHDSPVRRMYRNGPSQKSILQQISFVQSRLFIGFVVFRLGQ